MFDNYFKTVLVTGAGGGIGRSISKLFSDHNWNVLCHYNSSEKKIHELEQYFINNNCNYHLLKCDFSDREQVECFIDELDKFEINSLINNAGTFIKSNNNLMQIIELFMVNVFLPMLISVNIFEKMKQNNFGRIVNISSIGAKYGSNFLSMPYGCSKLALEGTTKTLSREGSKYNILVNTIRPGIIDTDFHQKSSKDMSQRISMIPLNKMGKPEDISKMAYYLGSEKNNFITNDIITISGGE